MAKKYSKEFKVEAVALLRTPGVTVAQAGRDLGVAESQLYKWRKEFAERGGAAFPGKGHLLPEDEEIRRLKRQNDQLRMERDILKKAPWSQAVNATVLPLPPPVSSSQGFGGGVSLV